MRPLPLAGEHFGAEEVAVTHVNVFQGNYGQRTFLNFRTNGGQRIHWKASNLHAVQPGQRVIVKGTVQEVDDSQQVVLTQGKMYPMSTHSAAPAQGAQPGSSHEGVMGVGRAVDSWIPAIIFIILSVVTLIPLVGLLVAVFLVPILAILTVVHGVRLYRRRGGVDPENSGIIRRNLCVAIGCLFLSLVGGGYQLAMAVTQILV